MWQAVSKLRRVLSGIVARDTPHEELVKLVAKVKEGAEEEIKTLAKNYQFYNKDDQYLITHTVKFPSEGSYRNVEVFTMLYRWIANQEDDNFSTALTVIYEAEKDVAPSQLFDKIA